MLSTNLTGPDRSPHEDPHDFSTSLYGIAALLVGCIGFIIAPILQHERSLCLPTRKLFLLSGLEPATQHQAFGSCPICKDHLFEAVRLPCEHVFCDACIRSALKTEHETCPTCRRILYCDNTSKTELVDRAKFTFWCIALVTFLTLNLWASARYLRWRSEMMWRWSCFLEMELLIQLTFVLGMSWVCPMLLVLGPEDLEPAGV